MSPRAKRAPEPPEERGGTRAKGIRNVRRSTFDPPKTDLWATYERYTSRVERAIAFIESECIVPSGRNAGARYKLLPFQQDDLAVMLADDTVVCVESMPRGAGKTGIEAALLVWALYDVEGAQVVALSTGMRTARLGYDRAVRMIDYNPRLAAQALIQTNATSPTVELPHRGAILFPLPTEEKHIVGMGPYLAAVDEIGYVDEPTYGAMQSALGKVPGSRLLGFGTPGLGTTEPDGRPNIMYRLRELARSEDPPAGLRYIERAADPQDDPGDPATWLKANPGLGVLVEESAVRLDYQTLTPARFGQMRLGLWTQHESAWMQAEVWDRLEIDPVAIPHGEAIGLGFDGSASGDATGLVAISFVTGRLEVLGVWERPPGLKKWSVPRREVMDRIHDAFELYNVVGMFADPWLWRSEIQELQRRYNRGGKEIVQEWNTGARSRMGPATDAFMSDALEGRIKWDGRPELRAHMLAAVAVMTPLGDVLVKDARKPQHIDLAIAAVLANEVRRLHEPRPARRLL